MNNPNILVHIGYHKTGSTWLQKVLFTHKDSGFMAIPRSKVNEHFCLVNSFSFCPNITRKAFDADLKEAKNKKIVLVLFHKVLSRNTIRRKNWGKEVADRLYETFPQALILIRPLA